MVTVLLCCLEMSGNMCVTGCYSLLFLCVACWIFTTLWLKLWHNSEHLCVFWWLLNIFCFWWLFNWTLKSSMSFIACFIVFLYSLQMCALFLWFCMFMCCLVTVSLVMHIHVLFLTVCWILLQFTMTMLAAVYRIVLQGAFSCFWYSSYISITFSLLASSLHIILL